MNKSTIIFIVGPTAIGKSALAAKLANRIRGEIISCDSMQVYKGTRILSQAPAMPLRKNIKHYLLEVLNPKEEYNVGIFRNETTRLIKSILRRGRIPIVVGGSGLYIKALIDGLFPSPQADLKFRNRMQTYILRHGSKKLYAKLANLDPETTGRIHPNDSRRIIRALEIYKSTGKTMTELKKETKGLAGKYNISTYGLTMPREKVYSNINSRVDRIFKDGVINEVKRLRKIALSKTAREILGFKEICGYLDGEYDLDTAKELLKRNTRHFAKRQLTWFRPDKRIRWFDLSRLSDKKVISEIIKEVR